MSNHITDADRAELAEIDAQTKAARLRRNRFFAKLRQRAYRQRKESQNDR